jgi:hypothetical protein
VEEDLFEGGGGCAIDGDKNAVHFRVERDLNAGFDVGGEGGVRVVVGAAGEFSM